MWMRDAKERRMETKRRCDAPCGRKPAMSRKHRIHVQRQHERPQAILLGVLVSCAIVMLAAVLLTMPMG